MRTCCCSETLWWIYGEQMISSAMMGHSISFQRKTIRWISRFLPWLRLPGGTDRKGFMCTPSLGDPAPASHKCQHLDHLQAAARARCPTSAMSVLPLSWAGGGKPHSHQCFLKSLLLFPGSAAFLDVSSQQLSTCAQTVTFSSVSDASFLGAQPESPHHKGSICMH